MLLALLACADLAKEDTSPDDTADTRVTDTADTDDTDDTDVGDDTGDTDDTDTDTGGGEPSLLGPFLDGDCDPLVPELCGLPFPSNVYLRADTATVSGARVAFGETTLPQSVSGHQSAPDLLNLSDGFSPAAGPILFLPGATGTGFAGPNSPEDSLAETSPTVLFDVTTGERVAHFAELDMSQDDDTRRVILIRPIDLLTPEHRYIVAVRGVVDEAGALVPASDAFAALRDGTPSEEPSVDARRVLYEDIFGHLADDGVEQADLQLAWDFTVASRESATDNMLAMRDLALTATGGGAAYTFDTVEIDPDPLLALRIEGTVEVPLFLDEGGPGGTLVRDADGGVVQNGTYAYPFVMIVPNSCRGRACPVVQYGHGLFGTRYAIDDEGYYEAADTFGAVVLSMDWIGMSREDVGIIAVAAAAGDVAAFATIPDRSQQGMVNLAVALRSLIGTMGEDPILTLDGVPVVDPDTRYYIGGSQGGIYGATYMALSQDIERGVLVVPGAAYSLMLPRSVYWAQYATPFVVNNFEDPRDVQLVLAYIQMIWDHAEPSGYASAITEDPFPDTPAHQVLLMEGVGDHQVPNLSTEVLARAVGATHLGPSDWDLYGLPPTEGPLSGNVLVEFDYGLAPVPEDNEPMTDGRDPHGDVFFEPAAQLMLLQFLTTGSVDNACDGACDPD